MKPKHLGLLILLASTGSQQLYATSFVADGVDTADYVQSARFYDNGKGCYWSNGVNSSMTVANGVWNQWGKTNSFDFLDGLRPRLVENEQTLRDDIPYAMTLHSKQWYANMTDDSATCWYQTSANMIQYWQSYYGVFAQNSEELPYGYTYSKDALTDLGGTQSLEVGMVFYDNVSNNGNYLSTAADWYLKGSSLGNLARTSPTTGGNGTSPGGYFADYFTNQRTSVDENYIPGMTKSEASALISDAMGVQINNNQAEIVTPGQIAYLGITAANGGPGHAITCYGFNLDANGQIESLLVTNSDDCKYEAFTVYLGDDMKLYTDADESVAWTYAGTGWILDEISYIDTPDELVQMYKTYTSQSSNLEWNGQQSTWSADAGSTTDELPTATTGWDVYVDSATNSTHSDYYHSYYSSSRVVEFGNHGNAAASITVDGQVKAAGLVLSADDGTDYSFSGNTTAMYRSVSTSTTGDAILLDGELLKTGDGVDTFSNLQVLAEQVSLQAGELAIQNGASLSAETGTVMSGATLSLAAGVVDIGQLEVQSGGIFQSGAGAAYTGNLTLADGASMVFDLAGASEYVLKFDGLLTLTGAIELSFTGAESMLNFAATDTPQSIKLMEFTQEQTFNPSLLQVSGAQVAYDANTQSIYMLAIPEPTTATLSLLALAGLAARRRR